MTEEIKEALDAITPAAPAVEKIPAGKLLVGIDLWKDPRVSGHLTTLVGWRGSDGRRTDWRPYGRIVVMRGGEVVAANWLAGQFDAKLGWRVVGARVTWCTKCTTSDHEGKTVPAPVMAPYAIWNAKDRDSSLRGLKSFWGIIKRSGACDCGSRVVEDIEREKATLTAFKREILEAFSRREEPVSRLIPPTFFTLVKLGSGNLPQCWEWLQEGLRKSHRADGTPTPLEAVPYRAGDRSPYLYNPGKWMGWVDGIDDPAIKGMILPGGISGRECADPSSCGFNPLGNDGL